MTTSSSMISSSQADQLPLTCLVKPECWAIKILLETRSFFPKATCSTLQQFFRALCASVGEWEFLFQNPFDVGASPGWKGLTHPQKGNLSAALLEELRLARRLARKERAWHIYSSYWFISSFIILLTVYLFYHLYFLIYTRFVFLESVYIYIYLFIERGTAYTSQSRAYIIIYIII